MRLYELLCVLPHLVVTVGVGFCSAMLAYNARHCLPRPPEIRELLLYNLVAFNARHGLPRGLLRSGNPSA